MARIRVATVIDARPRQVWQAIEDIERHVDWMREAEAIRFTSRRRGVGAELDCETRVGPLRTTDRMVVTEWRPPGVLGIRHVGAVTGVGRFTLRRARHGRTRFVWQEELRFPWWMGGPVGAFVGGQVLRRIWIRNLSTLKSLVESGESGDG